MVEPESLQLLFLELQLLAVHERLALAVSERVQLLVLAILSLSLLLEAEQQLSHEEPLSQPSSLEVLAQLSLQLLASVIQKRLAEA